jgi:hypothetical protein
MTIQKGLLEMGFEKCQTSEAEREEFSQSQMIAVITS